MSIDGKLVLQAAQARCKRIRLVVAKLLVGLLDVAGWISRMQLSCFEELHEEPAILGVGLPPANFLGGASALVLLAHGWRKQGWLIGCWND